MSVQQDVISDMIAWLKNQISDPANRGSSWIYPDYPRLDAAKPRISVTNTGGPGNEELGLGDQGKFYEYLIDIDIWVDTKTICTINDSTYSGSKLREYLADKVVSAIDNNRHTLRDSYGWNEAKTQPRVHYPYDEETDTFQLTIPVLVIIETPKPTPSGYGELSTKFKVS